MSNIRVMQKKLNVLIGLTACAVLWLALPRPAAAFDADMPPIEESRAYNQYSLRPDTILSRLVYLIDRFSEARIQVVYDGISYPASVAGPFARWFLGVRYEGQTEKEWIKQYCDKSIFTGQKIWVKDAHGAFAEGSKVLLEELETLNTLAAKKHPVS